MIGAADVRSELSRHVQFPTQTGGTADLDVSEAAPSTDSMPGISSELTAPLQSLDARLIVVAILVLVSFGMYLGRSVRLNSWDVRHPRSLVGKVADHLRSPGAVGNALGFTFLHAVFLGIIYLVVVGPVVAGLIALEEAR